MNETEIREAFSREFTGSQDARSQLHASFSEQGIRLIEHRKKLINTVITVSVGFIAAPAIFDIEPELGFYQTGLILLILSVILSLLHLREHVDIDESQLVHTRNKTLPILDRRITKLKEYIGKQTLDYNDLLEYKEYRQKEDYSDEMTKMVTANQKNLDAITLKAIDYPSAFIMLLFTSGAFFILSSVLFKDIELPLIILVELLLIIITSTNSVSKIFGIYAKFLNLFRN